MAFGAAGAAAGATEALAQMLAQRRLEAQLRLQQQQQEQAAADRQAQLELSRQDNARAQRQQQVSEAGLTAKNLQSLGGGTELTDAQTAPLADTPYAPLLRRQQTLPGTMAGGDPMTVGMSARPIAQEASQTIAEDPAQLERNRVASGRKTLAGLISRNAPRNEVVGQAVESGIALPAAELNDPQAGLDARAAQAEADRQTRLDIANIGAQGRADARSASAETTGLRNQLLQSQIDANQQKQTDAAAIKERNKQAAQATADETLRVLNQLATFDPASGQATLGEGTSNLFGMRVPFGDQIPGSKTATASAALRELTSRTIVDLLAEMKQQSKTGASGFGQLSERELQVLQNAATQLTVPNISDARAAEELSHIYSIVQRAKQPTAAAPAAGNAPAPARIRYDINGNRLP